MSERIDTQEFKLTREKVRNVDIPSINLYRLGVEEERADFIKRLVDLPEQIGLVSWTSNELSGVLNEALQREIFKDTYDLQLRDYAETIRTSFRGNERALTRFLGLNDNLENGTVAEYPWKKNGRFVRILDEDGFTDVAYSRNRFIIPEAVQEGFKKDVFAAGGLAVGGNTAYLFMLSGVENWVVADGGLLDLHDFNRIIGSKVEDIGLNQAVRWTRMALERDPYLKIKCIPQNLGTGEGNTINYDDFLEGTDRVIEAVDALNVKGELRLRSDVIMPTDMGLGAKVDEDRKGLPFHGRFNQEELESLLDPGRLDIDTKTELAIKIVGLTNIPPSYLLALREARQKNVQFWPQTGLSAFLSASMIVAREIVQRNGLPVKDEASLDLGDFLTSRD